MFNIKYVTIAVIGALVGGFIAYNAVNQTLNIGGLSDTFLSIQLASSPQNGYVLSTDGTNNSWIVNTGGGGGVTTTVEYNDVDQGILAVLDLDNTFFTVSESPSSEFNVTGIEDAQIGSTTLNASNWTVGDVLQASSTGLEWVATSSLGIAGGGGASALADLSDVAAVTYTAGRLLLGDGGSSYDDQAMSGDATINGSGVLSLASNSVQDAEIDYTAVTLTDFTNDANFFDTLAGIPDYITALGSTLTLGTVDISDDTNLVAGTNITLTGDTLNVDDAFLLNSGDIGTGVFDFGGATSFELPQNSTINAAGELTVRTATSTLEFYDGTNEQVLSPFVDKSFEIGSTTLDTKLRSFDTGTTSRRIWCPNGRYTLTDIYGIATSTGSVAVQVGDGSNWSEVVRATASGVSDDGTITNATYNNRECVTVRIGSQVSDPNGVTVNLTFKRTP